MSLGLLLIDLGESSPHLPALVDEDHHAALPDLLHVLSTEFSANLVRLESTHTSTPGRLKSRLSKIRDSMGHVPDSILVLIRSYVTAFERTGQSFCSIAVRESIPGRPGSMISAAELARTLAFTFPAANVLVAGDLEILPSSSRRTEGPSMAEMALMGVNDIETGAESCSAVFRIRAAETRHRRLSLTRALTNVLRSAADAGVALSYSELSCRVKDYLTASGAVTLASGSRVKAQLRPQNPFERLPDYIRTDLYSPDPGSRLDAVVELGDLAKSGNPTAVLRLEYLRDADASADVRGYASRCLRRGGQTTVKQMIDFGLVSDRALQAAETIAPPPFSELFEGLGVMGVDAPLGQTFERPAHAVSVAPFRIALRPTTNLDYLAYVLSTGAECPAHWNSGWVFLEDLNHPVVMVSWYEARQYCQWLTAHLHATREIPSGDRLDLPSEAEWEIAARNSSQDLHPWGDRFNSENCNVRATGIGGVVEAGSFTPMGDSKTGCVDLIGNVWEWTNSAWGRSGRTPRYLYPYNHADGREDPDLGADVRRVVRGGGFYYAEICSNSYTRNRVSPADRHPAGGFRVVMRSRS